MTAWIGLLRKDFRVGRSTIFGILATIIVANFLMIFVISDEKERFSLSSAFFNLALYYLLPTYLFNSLLEEGKMLHRWLHNPQPAWMLIFSKILNGFLALIMSLAVSAFFTVYVVSSHKGHLLESFQGNFFHVIVGIVISFGISLFIVFLWSLYHSMKAKFGKLRWLFLVLASFVIPLLIAGSFFGLAKISTNSLFSIFLLGIWYLIIFFMSAWLLEKKVEA